MALEGAEKLLDFNQKLDINLLDNVIKTMYHGSGAQQKSAQEVLVKLQNHPDAWQRVDLILEYSTNQETKHYALQILTNVIKTRWKILPRTQCDGVKKFIVGVIINISSDAAQIEKEKVFINKLNTVLIEIVKQEWPRHWPQFISEIVGSSKSNENLCKNNMIILKLLSEEVFDFSQGIMTQAKVKHLKDTMCSEFSEVFNLCSLVMDNSTSIPLVQATLNTLLGFLNWIPLGYIFETKLINQLTCKFLSVPDFRNITLKCLTEIAGIDAKHHSDEFCELFNLTMTQIKPMLPLTTNLRDAYKSGRDDEQEFIQNLALFLSTIMKEQGTLIESKNDLSTSMMEALHYLVLISEVEEKEIFKICLEYWNCLASDLYRESPYSSNPITFPLFNNNNNATPPRRQIYLAVLSKVRVVLISHMAKPEEVLVVENDQGEVVREFMKDTDAISLYKTMRETLVYLTHLDYADTENIMTEKLRSQVDGSEWSWKNLNTLCWAIGSISGAMHEEDEKRFLVCVIKDLLGMCEQKRGKDNKAIIASNIMYIVGQYPRFLRQHWKFLKTVVNKLFEFMHETHDGVQDMACDTFIKIAQKCKRHFVTVQVAEVMPFIEEILSGINAIICDLQPHQVHTFYEAVGYMIQAQADVQVQERLIEKLMSLPNQVWDRIINNATHSVDTLKDPECVKQLGNILKTNVRSCQAIGHPFVTQLGRIYLDMLNVYQVLSENISSAVQQNGEQVLKQPLVASMRTVKKETLKLISAWVGKSTDPKQVCDNFVPPLLNAVLGDYNRNHPNARDAEVLSTMTVFINKLSYHITPEVPKIFNAVFECTLEMIKGNFEDFPEHRTNFYLLLEAINNQCFPALLQIPADKFKVVMDSIVWAFKHTMRNVADTGLMIVLTMLQNLDSKDVAQSFYQTYFLNILQHIFSVVTDSTNAAQLANQTKVLAFMFSLVEQKKITVTLCANPAEYPGVTDNEGFVKCYTQDLLKKAFPNLQDMQVTVFVDGMFALNQDTAAFREHLRDFIVQIKECAGEDLTDLYLQERQVQLKDAAQTKLKYQMTVPGILNPHEVTDDMSENI